MILRPDAREYPVNNADFSLVRRNETADLGHQGDEGDLPEEG